MAKFYGAIGYVVTTEKTPGVWVNEIVEHFYYGDLLRNNRKLVSAESLNDNITISNEISILADPFAYENFHMMLYVEWMGTKWKISNVDVQYPRLILTVGGLYHSE